MDGTGEQFVFGAVIQPNGLAIDIPNQRLYWCDTIAATIIYATVGSTGIIDLQTLQLTDGNIEQPFSITLSTTSVFWTDWSTNSLYSTHKDYGSGESGHLFTVFTSSVGTPRGVQVVSSSNQNTDGKKNLP